MGGKTCQVLNNRTINIYFRLVCCSATTQTSICPVPKSPAKDRDGGYIYCSGGAEGSCPAGYECYFHDGIYICCTTGGINAYTCPTGKSPLIDKERGEIQRCRPSEEDSCPLGYACEYSAKGYLCCSSQVPSADYAGRSSENPYFSTKAVAAAAAAQRSPATISLSMSPDLPIIKEAMRYICPTSMLNIYGV